MNLVLLFFWGFSDQRGPSIQSDLEKSSSISDAVWHISDGDVGGQVYGRSEVRKMKFSDRFEHPDTRTPPG